MALSGVHIAAGYVGGAGQGGNVQPLNGKAVWSQTMASPGTTALGAPGYDTSLGAPSFEIRSSADIYVAVGTSPDASQVSGSGNSARLFIPANETRNIFCSSGDKLAWILVP